MRRDTNMVDNREAASAMTRPFYNILLRYAACVHVEFQCVTNYLCKQKLKATHTHTRGSGHQLKQLESIIALAA